MDIDRWHGGNGDSVSAEICFKLDTGADVTVIPQIDYRRAGSPSLDASTKRLVGANDNSASNYSEIFSDNNGRGTLCPSDIGNKWKANVSVARMNDVHILREMIEIRDGFKECCILSKEDVSDIIDNLTVF